MITFENVSYSYPNGNPALGVSEVHNGGQVTIHPMKISHQHTQGKAYDYRKGEPPRDASETIDAMHRDVAFKNERPALGNLYGGGDNGKLGKR